MLVAFFSLVPLISSRLQAYLVDYYVYSSKSYPGEPPNHIGFSYILPSTLQASVGQLTVPITSTKHRPIGKYFNEPMQSCSIDPFKIDSPSFFLQKFRSLLLDGFDLFI